MWSYWILFLVPGFWAVSRLKPVPSKPFFILRDRWPVEWRGIYILLVLMIGLRHEVGGDWYQYIEMLDSYTDTTTVFQYKFQDPAFVIFNHLAAWSGAGVYLLNLLSAIFFSWGLIVFCRAQPRPWLALLVAVPYLITVVAMGYTRQGVAIGIAMVAMVALGQGRILGFIMLVGFASLFHKSAIILVPMAFLASTKRRTSTLIWVTITSVVLYFLLLQESLSFWVGGYIEFDYQSSGTLIRVSMNALPAIVFLIFQERFELSPNQKSFWKWMSWSAFMLLGLLIVSPSSTAIDRVALYWIPLQLFVFSRLPNVLGKRDGKNAGWVYVVVAYSAVVHFVWLMYADTAFAWLPYQFYPWVWLWY